MALLASQLEVAWGYIHPGLAMPSGAVRALAASRARKPVAAPWPRSAPPGVCIATSTHGPGPSVTASAACAPTRQWPGHCGTGTRPRAEQPLAGTCKAGAAAGRWHQAAPMGACESAPNLGTSTLGRRRARPDDGGSWFVSGPATAPLVLAWGIGLRCSTGPPAGPRFPHRHGRSRRGFRVRARPQVA